MDSFGVYIHVPYCRTICPYCDFNVHAPKTYPWSRLAQSIIREMKRRAPLFEDKPAGTIYFGGGTPSLAPPEFFAEIIEAVGERFELLGNREITVETNPGTIDQKGLEKWRAVGINRVSLGWQTTHPRLLKVLGRDHTVEESVDAFYDARRAGFDNISVDLIFAVPGQKESELEADLEKVIALEPDHVSIYEMTFHDRTPYAFYRKKGRIKPLADESVLTMTVKIEEALLQADYEQYEVSNFARPNKRSEHNQRYWTGSSFLGLGPGAHSFVRDGWVSGCRWESRRNPKRYMEAFESDGRGVSDLEDGSVEFYDSLNARQLLNERIMTGVRLLDGIAVQELALGDFAEGFWLAHLEGVKRDWLVDVPSRLQATPLGRRYADSLAELFF